MRLSSLTRGFTVRGGSGDPDITLVTEDSRQVRPGALFVAIAGTAQDGHQYIRQALDRGAAAIVLQRADALPGSSIAHAIVPNTRVALATIAARFYGSPADQLSIVGFTGTFGKTTTSEILRSLLEAAGRKPAVVGSLGARYERFEDRGSGLTTPAPPQLHSWLATVKDLGARTVILEVTSHALRLDRVKGVSFTGGLLAAIMPGEHTDFHRTYEDYVSAKRLFLEYLRPDAVLAYDADNRASRQLAGEAAVSTKLGFTLGPNGACHQLPGNPQLVTGAAAALDEHGIVFRVRDRVIRSSLLGRPNIRNVALALAYALASGMTLDEVQPVLASLRPLPRRTERLRLAGRTVLDDTSGHPDSLMALFEVEDLLERKQLWIVWAVRGSRGVDVNRANAFTLADLASLQDAAGLIVTASEDVTSPADQVTGEEIDAVRAALQLRGRPYDFRGTLQESMETVAARSAPGDLIVLAGAQGMNEGRRLLEQALRSG
jgi:UDP-N-acetylmuramoyl-L-alanyl-D-glutamate--2,6-diaminopimelate ligase